MPVASPIALCRLDDALIDELRRPGRSMSVEAVACTVILVCSMIYGAVFGLWRGAEQTWLSAVKMPILVFAVVGFSGAINVMLAQVMGTGLTARQVMASILLGLTIMTMLLAAFSPVVAFFVSQTPGPDAPHAMRTYRVLLVGHTAVIGACGFFGHLRLFQLIRRLTGSQAMAARVLTSWIAITFLAGSELSWVVSPFLARPDLPIPWLNPNAFTSNFFEYLWRAASSQL